MQNDSLLVLQDVNLSFVNVERAILQNINYQLFRQDFVIVLGSNGSGKSSLIKVIKQQYPLSSGNLIFQGNLISQFDGNMQQEIILLSQIMQESLFFELTVLENCILWDMQTKKLASEKSSRSKKFFQQYLLDFNQKLADKIDTQTKKLSGGEKQALILGLCLLRKPKLLLLDEHTSALDPKTAEKIIMLTARLINQHKLTCMMTTHNLEHAIKYGNKLISLKDGCINYQVAGKEKQSLSTMALLQHCY